MARGRRAAPASRWSSLHRRLDIDVDRHDPGSWMGAVDDEVEQSHDVKGEVALTAVARDHRGDGVAPRKQPVLDRPRDPNALTGAHHLGLALTHCKRAVEAEYMRALAAEEVKAEHRGEEVVTRFEAG